MYDLANNCTLQMFELGSSQSHRIASRLIQVFLDSGLFSKTLYAHSPSPDAHMSPP